jgi:hypothetical protein
MHPKQIPKRSFAVAARGRWIPNWDRLGRVVSVFANAKNMHTAKFKFAMLGLALFVGVSVREACGNEGLQRARQQVLTALVATKPVNGSAPNRNQAASWAQVSESIVQLLASHDNADRTQLTAIHDRLSKLQTSDPAYRKLQQAVAAWLDQLPASPLTQLADDARREAELFVPVDESSIKTLQQQLQQKLQIVERQIELTDAWRKFLGWEMTYGLANSGIPTEDLANRLLNRWLNASTSWDRPELFAVQQSLSALAVAVACWEQQESSSTRTTRIDRLAGMFTSARETGKPFDAAAIEAVYWEMMRFGQAPALCVALANQYSHANFVIRMNPSVLFSGVDRPVSHSFPINAVYAGSQVSGTGRFTGQLQVEPSYAVNEIKADVRLAGESTSQTQGGRNRVAVRSRGLTRVTSRRELSFAGFGPPVWQATQASASTTITFDNISANVPRRQRQAAINEVYASKSASETRASEEARSWISRELETNTNQLTQDPLFQSIYRFRDQLFAQDLCQPVVKCGSFPGVIDWRLWQSSRQRFAAQQPLPERPLEAAMQIAMHASFLEFSSESRMAGQQLMAGESFDWLSNSFPLDGNVAPAPAATAESSTSPPASILFTKAKPVNWKIEDGKVVVDLNLQRIEADGDTFSDYVAKIAYEPQITLGRLRLVPAEDIDVLPAGFDPDREKLGSRRLSLCRLIERRLQRFLSKDIPLPELNLAFGREASRRAWPVTGVFCEDGWLEIAYDRPGSRTSNPGKGG